MFAGGKKCRQSGQVLAAGIFILLILLVVILVGFDVYNAIRAKFKVETAQEAAALAGADWQKESLNLIGEINIIKACSLLVEGDENWSVPLPSAENDPQLNGEDLTELRRIVLQSRVNILTQMQTRVSFLGPLIGFAAAQQAAKANGIQSLGSLSYYVELLENNGRYREEAGGAPRYVNGYDWRLPYMEFVRTISSNGIAVYPNARVYGSPVVYPPELKSENFYSDILAHAAEIEKANGGAVPFPQKSWRDTTLRFVYKDQWKSSFKNEPWWDIDYSYLKFPGESEIFSLEVTTDTPDLQGVTEKTDKIMEQKSLSAALRASLYTRDTLPQNLDMDFFVYEESWYPSILRRRYKDYDSEHYDFWFTGTTLRKPVKPQYRYEGPAAYVETYADVGRVSSLFRISGQRRYMNELHTRVGSRRTATESGVDMAEYRPGTIAKALGELNGNEPPTALPLIMPVFKEVSIMPTYMPIPYGFGVLRPRRNVIEEFLSWLSQQRSITGPDASMPPAGLENYLMALLYLIQDETFRYYGWNPAFDADAFNAEWRNKPVEWHNARVRVPSQYQYNPKNGKNLPGYLQEPQIFYSSADSKQKQETVKDYINGGYATRYYVDKNTYIVVDSRNRIVTNYDPDPTLDYTSIGGGGGGGSGFGTHGGKYDVQKGPARL